MTASAPHRRHTALIVEMPKAAFPSVTLSLRSGFCARVIEALKPSTQPVQVRVKRSVQLDCSVGRDKVVDCAEREKHSIAILAFLKPIIP